MKPARGTIEVFETADAVTKAAVALFKKKATEALSARDHFAVAFSGGRTPETMLTMIGDTLARTMDWSKVSVFLVDDRDVPRDAPQSNYAMIARTLLSRVAIPERQVYRWRTEAASPEDALRDYEAVLKRVGPLDLVYLGMGGDAHTASLFPGSKALHVPEAPVLHLDDAGAEPRRRYTMNYPVLNAARCVAFIVTGADKRDALRRTFAERGENLALPATKIHPRQGELLWLCDKAATGE